MATRAEIHTTVVLAPSLVNEICTPQSHWGDTLHDLHINHTGGAEDLRKRKSARHFPSLTLCCQLFKSALPDVHTYSPHKQDSWLQSNFSAFTKCHNLTWMPPVAYFPLKMALSTLSRQESASTGDLVARNWRVCICFTSRQRNAANKCSYSYRY